MNEIEAADHAKQSNSINQSKDIIIYCTMTSQPARAVRQLCIELHLNIELK